MRRWVMMAAVLAMAGCAAGTGRLAENPNPPPPPVRAEVVPPPLSAQSQIWQPGHWDWDGAGGYIWREGSWVDRASHGTRWLEGYWSSASGAWAWVPAHWV